MSMHYKRITAVAIMAIIAIGLTTCKKEKIDAPTVKVFEGAITINYTKASVSAEVTDQGGAEVVKVVVRWIPFFAAAELVCTLPN